MAEDTFDPKRAQPAGEGFSAARAVPAASGFNPQNAQPVRSSFWKDFAEGTGGLTGLLAAPFTESIPAKAVQLAAEHPGEFAEGAIENLPATAGNPMMAVGASIGGMVMRRVEQFLASDQATDLPGQARQAFSDTVKLAKQRPGLMIGSILKGAIADPELFFVPGATEAVAGRAATTALEGSRAARVVGASVGKATGVVTGAEIGAGSSVLSDLADDRPINVGEAEVGGILGAAAGGAVQVRGKAPKIRPMTAAEVEAQVGPAMEAGVTPKPEVVPSADGYLVRIEGQEGGKTFPTKPEAENAAKQLERTASGYRAMATTPNRPWRTLIHADPFNQEAVIEKQGADIKPARDDLVGFFRRAIIPGAIGATLGYWLDKDEPLEGAAAGAAFTVLPKLLPRDVRVSAAPGINLRNGLLRVFARKALNFKNSIETLVPEKMRREAIAAYLEGRIEVKLNPDELRAAHAVREYFDAMGNTAVDAGIVKELLRNYVTHIVEADPEHVSRGTKPPSTIEAVVDVLTGRADRPAGSVASGRQFAKHRRYATFDELQKALQGSGLRIKTFDIAEIAAIYGNAMFRAVTDKRLLDALKQTPVPEKPMPPLVQPVEALPRPEQKLIGEGGFKLPPEPPPGEAAQRFAARKRMMIQAIDKADDSTYVQIPARQLAGYAVHRDIAPQLQFIFSARDPNDWSIGAMALNQASKRAIVSFSLFHANSLSDAYIGAMGLRGAADIAKLTSNASRLTRFQTMVDKAMAQFRYGGNNEGIDDLLMHGLELSAPDEFRPEGMGPALARIASVLDRHLPVGSVAVKAANAISHFNDSLDHMTFAYLQTGYKLVTGLDAYERLLKKGMPRKAAATLAASYTNDLYGSLDWFRVANDVGSRLGREAAYSFFQPRGRRIMQLLMFAPDWTFSTYRAAYKSLPGSVDDPALSALHRRYMLKSALYYLTVANGINLVASGHPIWRNENPTRVQLKDGRTMQFSKHYMEPFEWLRDPRQTFLNKFAFIPREAIEELTGKEYLSAHDAAPLIKDRAEHIAAQFLPIPAQQGIAGGGNLSVLGVFGKPVYGKDPEQKAQGRRQKQLDKREQDKKKADYYRRLHQE